MSRISDERLGEILAAAQNAKHGRFQYDAFIAHALDYEVITALITELRELRSLSRRSSDGVAVRGLEWGPESGLGFFRAPTPFGEYVIMPNLNDGGYTWWFGVQMRDNGRHSPTVDAAKAAAQSHFDAAIRSALEPSPAPVVDEGMVHAFAEYEGITAEADTPQQGGNNG